MTIGFIFPGQGSQAVGMGKDLFDQAAIAREFFQLADVQLGRQLSRICFEGPEEELKKTVNTQPALFVCEAILCQLLMQRGIKPQIVAGHSLGEYSALYAAGVFDFPTGLRLVDIRAQAMQEAAEQAQGSMAAIVGLDAAQLETLCQEVGGIVVVANFNSPEQVVISGETDAVSAAMEKAARTGARRVVPLAVSGAFHSPLVAEASGRMAAALTEVELVSPAIDFVNNADACWLNDPEEIKDSLARQIVSPVRWVETLMRLSEKSPAYLVEVGPGRVLAGLCRRTIPEVKVLGCATLDQLEKIASATGRG